MLAAISCSDLSFSWPDGQPVLSDVTMSIGPGRTGLIGTNGSGKSTLLRLFAGELRPASGVLRVTGEVGYLPQAITLGTHQTVADLLGIGRVRAALHAIEGGDVSPEAFAEVGDDWDVEERALAWLDRLGIAGTAGLMLSQPRRSPPGPSLPRRRCPASRSGRVRSPATCRSAWTSWTTR